MRKCERSLKSLKKFKKVGNIGKKGEKGKARWKNGREKKKGERKWRNVEKVQGQNVIPFFQRFELRTPRFSNVYTRFPADMKVNSFRTGARVFIFNAVTDKMSKQI